MGPGVFGRTIRYGVSQGKDRGSAVTAYAIVVPDKRSEAERRSGNCYVGLTFR